MCSTSCSRCWTTAVSPTARAARWTSRTPSSSSPPTWAASTCWTASTPDGEISAAGHATRWNELLKRSFRPEFLNRLDEIVFYKPLTRDNVTHIIDLMVDEPEPPPGGQAAHGRTHRRGQGLHRIDEAYDPVYRRPSPAPLSAAHGGDPHQPEDHRRASAGARHRAHRGSGWEHPLYPLILHDVIRCTPTFEGGRHSWQPPSEGVDFVTPSLKNAEHFEDSSLVHALTAWVGFPTCRPGGAYAKNLPLASFLNAAALTSLRREKTDVHAASFFNLISFPSASGRNSARLLHHATNKLFFGSL